MDPHRLASQLLEALYVVRKPALLACLVGSPPRDTGGAAGLFSSRDLKLGQGFTSPGSMLRGVGDFG